MEVLMGNSLERPWEHWSLWMEVLKAFQSWGEKSGENHRHKIGKIMGICTLNDGDYNWENHMRIGDFPAMFDGWYWWWMFIMFISQNLWKNNEQLWFWPTLIHSRNILTYDSEKTRNNPRQMTLLWKQRFRDVCSLLADMTWSQVADCTRSFSAIQPGICHYHPCSESPSCPQPKEMMIRNWALGVSPHSIRRL